MVIVWNRPKKFAIPNKLHYILAIPNSFRHNLHGITKIFWLLFGIAKKIVRLQTNSINYWWFQKVYGIIFMELLRFFGYCLGSPKKLAIPNKFHQILAIPKNLRHNLHGIARIFWLLFGIAKKCWWYQTNSIKYWWFQTV